MRGAFISDDRPRRRRWLRGLLAVAVVLVLLAVAATLLVRPRPADPAPTLPATVAAPTGPLDGMWTVTTGSRAGFRVQETVLGMRDDAAGATDQVTGRIEITGDRVTATTVGVDLTAVRVGGEPQPQFAASLDVQQYPTATITLTRPVELGAGFATGATATTTAAGLLTLHGATHPVTVTIAARRDGDALRTTGTIPVTFSDWGITGPDGYGDLGSLADHGTAEFLLVARHA